MAVLTPRRYLTPLIHVLVWGLFGLTFLLFQPLTGRLTMPPQFWLKQGLLFCVWVSTFYFTGKVLVPRLLFPGRTGWFILALFVTTVAILLFSKFLESALNLPALMDKAFEAAAGRPRAFQRKGPHIDTMGLLTTMFVLGISTCITVVQKWQKDAQLRQTLEQQRVSSELSMLKAQINPHFFFNTLNNIYALTLLDGEQARTAIHRLSRMMRYVLYDTAGGMTLLSQEIAFVQDYITLMQLRLDERVTVTFERPEPVHDVPVAPMLLLPFLENAFKHGVAATESSKIYVSIRQPRVDVVELEVRNSRLTLPSTDLAGSNGIGLANTRRRLDLLYPGRYHLVVDDHTPANEFVVYLTLQIGAEATAAGLASAPAIPQHA
ncbi:sensor histidine kinase [Hymenobacter properus]|uniref:Sensor histidine kinase n=1 Tax=Hymenobacter properus TaxID=2791026 RepID=A0A931BBK5_9BACT|nr:sensor histidine kinase [Hymenobacter properus]MBF9140739.1 sensor histidine kinase [Hymenobacter properus]MBR7719547.1 sensor histidine kinase [Microvirga sp. SRT04]